MEKMELRMKQPKTPRQRLAPLLIAIGHNATILRKLQLYSYTTTI